MKCALCNQNVATVHLTEIFNKVKREIHLCEQCAREKGFATKIPFWATELPEKKPAAPQEPPAAPQKVQAQGPADELAGACPVCNLTFAEFRANGRLGCANDYTVFRKGLVPLLEKIHGGCEHRGKVPAHFEERLERQKKVATLRQALHRAIQTEAYEDAARLRDEIRALEERS